MIFLIQCLRFLFHNKSEIYFHQYIQFSLLNSYVKIIYCLFRRNDFDFYIFHQIFFPRRSSWFLSFLLCCRFFGEMRKLKSIERHFCSKKKWFWRLKQYFTQHKITSWTSFRWYVWKCGLRAFVRNFLYKSLKVFFSIICSMNANQVT